MVSNEICATGENGWSVQEANILSCAKETIVGKPGFNYNHAREEHAMGWFRLNGTSDVFV